MTGSSTTPRTSSTFKVSIANEVLSLTSSLSNSTNPADILSSIQNGPFGPTTYHLGNGLTAIGTYDTLGRTAGGWVCNGSSQPNCTGGTGFYGFTSNWIGVRETGGCDTVLNACIDYGYDQFNRLSSRTVPPGQGTAQNFSYVYDRYGNRWQQNLTAGSGPTSSLSFSATSNRITTSGFAYDAAGNLTNDGFHTYTYDAEGNVTAVDSGSTAKYVYNALNQRVSATVGSTVTEFLFNASGQRASEWNGATHAQIRGQYYWGGKPVAFYASGGAATFQHQDWLGTERMRTTYNGGVAGSYFSLPFGDGYAASGTDADPNHFATLDQDSETETEHAQFRQYSSAQGHWLSPDPYDGSYDLTNPQSFNRYAYAGNNPLSFNDPSGLYIVPGCGGCWGAGNQNTGETGGDGEFSVYDTVDTYAGSYSYSGDVWDATMADGFGGGVQGGMNGPLYSSDETGDQFLGYVWQSMLLTGSPGIVSGTVVAPSNFSPTKFAFNSVLASKLGGLPTCKTLDNIGDATSVIGAVGVIITSVSIGAIVLSGGTATPVVVVADLGLGAIWAAGNVLNVAAKHDIGCWE
jgi:RHS repeat-associated protein